MSTALLIALFFTVALLVITTYFILGGVPLLILKHDTPMDSRFVRGFFDTCYLVTMMTATATAVSYVFAGWSALAAGAVVLALLAAILRRKIIPRMDALRDQIQVTGESPRSAVRRIHAAAKLLNVTQLVLILWSLIAVSVSLR